MAIDLRAGHLLAAIAISSELPGILDATDEDLCRNRI